MSGFLLLGEIVGGIIVLWIVLSGIRFIPNNRIGIVEKRWSFTKGSVKSGLIRAAWRSRFSTAGPTWWICIT